MATRVVLDTNVYISGLFWKGAPHRVLRLGFDGKYGVLVSPQIIEEVFNSLANKFKFSPADTRSFVEIISAHAEIVTPKIRLKAVHGDPSDDKIIECAVAGHADYVVTGDKVLLAMKRYREIEIITPAKFLIKI